MSRGSGKFFDNTSALTLVNVRMIFLFSLVLLIFSLNILLLTYYTKNSLTG